MPNENKEASLAFSRALTSMLSRKDSVFFATCAFLLERIQDSTIDTAATNGIWVRYNPDFFMSVNRKQRQTVVAHEVLHVVLSHCVKLPDHIDFKTATMAMDYVINSMLKGCGFEPLVIPEIGFTWLQEDRFDNMSWHEVYRLLIKENPPQEGQGKPQEGQGKPQEGQGKPQEGQGGNKPDPSKNSDGSKSGCCSGTHAPDTKADGTKMSPEQVEQANKQIEAMVTQAAMVAEQQGTMPGNLRRIVDSLISSKSTWYDELREFISEQAKNDYSYSRPNRFYLNQGLIVPGLYSEELGSVHVVCDTSGSIDKNMLQRALSKIAEIMQFLPVSDIVVHYVDSRYAGCDRLSKEDAPLTPESFDPKGGGGTCFKPAFKKIADDDESPACLVYLTDMCCNSYPDEPDYPVIWCNVRSGNPWRDAPFGKYIALDDIEA